MSELTYNVRLLPGADAVLDAVARGSLTEPGPYRLQLQAERLLLVAGFDELICLDTLDFAPFGYQVKAAQTTLRRFRGRDLLCDEVGLGNLFRVVTTISVINEFAAQYRSNWILTAIGLALIAPLAIQCYIIFWFIARGDLFD